MQHEAVATSNSCTSYQGTVTVSTYRFSNAAMLSMGEATCHFLKKYHIEIVGCCSIYQRYKPKKGWSPKSEVEGLHLFCSPEKTASESGMLEVVVSKGTSCRCA